MTCGSSPAGASPPFTDRSRRLVLCGALAVGVGLAAIGLALLQLALPLLARHASTAGLVRVDTRAVLSGALLDALLGAAIVTLGVGSIRRRRWVRPLMLALAWSWLFCGVALLLLLPGFFDVALGSLELDPALLSGLKIALLGGVALAGVALPALFVLAYRDVHVQRTCEAHDPRPDWTARCPPSVLGLSVGLGAGGVLAALTAIRPVVPWFGRLVTGLPAAAALLAGAGLCIWLARETYRLRMQAWWGTTALLVLIGVTSSLTFEREDPEHLLLAMGYPEPDPGQGAAFVRAALWITVAITAASVVYMIGIRHHFGSGEQRGDRAT